MIESDIEEKMAVSFAQIAEDYDVCTSWNFVEDGEVKEDEVSGKKGTISIYVQPMAHDDFSLPTVTLNGVVTIEARVEMCPSMKSMVGTFSALQKRLSVWHYKPLEFSEYFSTDEFYATELKLNSGDKVTFDRSTNCWLVTIGFTIRGSQNFEDLTND